jgi:hypothetical protein
VGASEDGAWSQAFPWLAGRADGLIIEKHRQALLNVEGFYRRSAAALRISGQHDHARAVEQYADWARFNHDDPQAARQLHAMSADLRGLTGPGQILGQALERAMTLLAAERGNVQILDPAIGGLTIVAQAGFSAEFLEYFAAVHDDRAACGRAAQQRSQIVVADVITDRGFAIHRGIAAASGFRAVQSTPLTDRSGRVVGVLSTHYPRPHHPHERDMRIMKHYGEFIGSLIAGYLWSPPRFPDGHRGRPPR